MDTILPQFDLRSCSLIWLAASVSGKFFYKNFLLAPFVKSALEKDKKIFFIPRNSNAIDVFNTQHVIRQNPGRSERFKVIDLGDDILKSQVVFPSELCHALWSFHQDDQCVFIIDSFVLPTDPTDISNLASNQILEFTHETNSTVVLVSQLEDVGQEVFASPMTRYCDHVLTCSENMDDPNLIRIALIKSRTHATSHHHYSLGVGEDGLVLVPDQQIQTA